MDDIERRVLAAVDEDGLIDYLAKLVAIRSLTGEETDAQENVAGKMEQIGLAVDAWPIDFVALKEHPAYSAEIDRDEGMGVVGTMGEGEGPSLIFNGHVDVVPAGDASRWRYPPWEGTVVGGRVYGRGAVDMKGGLTCALFAAKAILDAGIHLKGKLLIQSVIGEEDGGSGTLAAVMRGYTADGAIVIEPTNLIIAPSQAGALNFRVTVEGLAAHGALREEGVSAIEKFMPIYQALMALEKERNSHFTDPLFAGYQLPHPICVGTMQAGDWASSVADWLSFEGRYGLAVGENLADAREMLESTVAREAGGDAWLKAHPPKIEWWGGQFAPASIPRDHYLVQTVSQAWSEVSGREAVIEGMTYGADMRLLVNEGNTPTVLFGPGDVRQAHRPNEYVPVSDLIQVAKSLALAALRFCGVAGS